MPRVISRILALLLAAVTLAAAGCAADKPELITGSVTAGKPEPVTASAPDAPYILGSGDRLRIMVFNQPSLSSTYAVGANGTITMPLIGPVEAVGRSPYDLKKTIEARLAKDFLRDPNVSVEVEGYRPFFIFGEVIQGGQYPYVAGMTAEQAIAIAGGFTPRAQRRSIQLARRDGEGVVRVMVPLTTLVQPGDTIYVKERWF